MLALKEFRSSTKGLPDLLNYAALVDEGVVLNKDGSFSSAYFFRGNDLGSSTVEELSALSAHANSALSKMSSGWMIHVDSIRVPATSYPGLDKNHFPDPVTALIDAERRAQHEAEGNHFDTVFSICFTYLTPPELSNKISAVFVDEDVNPAFKEESSYSRVLERFKDSVTDIVGSFSGHLKIRKMTSGELLTYLHTCVSAERHPVRVPSVPMYLDAVLGSKDFFTGLAPRVGKKHIRTISITGFPSESQPGILDALNSLRREYRWSTRFIALDPLEAEKKLNVFRRNWFQKRHGLMGLIKGAMGGGEQTWQNGDAVRMAVDVDAAINENSEGAVRFGYYTSVIVISSENIEEVEQSAREISKILGNMGFPCFIETINAVEAYLGSLPGHGFQNVRRPLMHTLNLADLLPFTSIWAGHDHHPCGLYPAQSPSLIHASTDGATPFRLNLHVGDLGHFAIFGPPGMGKSTLLNCLIAQHFKYPDAQVFGFDFGYSMATLCEAANGNHYDIASDYSNVGFCPLGQIDTPADRNWACWFIELLCTLRMGSGSKISLGQQNEISRCIDLMSKTTEGFGQRTLTHFIGTVQDLEIKSALSGYTIDSGAVGAILDSDRDALAKVGNSRFFIFEMSNLFSLGEKAIIPVMMYIFRQIEKRVSKKIPTLIPIDEAFRSFGHPLAIEKLNQWLEVMRKENAAVGFATQNIDTVLKSSIGTSIVQTTATKIFLPNPEAMNQVVAPLYKDLGLNERQIETISFARPKSEYYLINADGKRRFSLGLGPLALAFTAVSGKEQAEKIRALKAQYGNHWVKAWLQERGINQDWIQFFDQLKTQY
jgi:type IV secretion/conjugal transfer VirB4 family ATPase